MHPELTIELARLRVDDLRREAVAGSVMRHRPRSARILRRLGGPRSRTGRYEVGARSSLETLSWGRAPAPAVSAKS